MRGKSMLRLSVAILFVVSAAAGAPPPALLNMSQALETALSRHPALSAAEARVSATAGLQRQAGLRPNPSVSLELENWRAWGDPEFRFGEDIDLFFYGSQPLETGGKRARRIELADRDMKIAGLEKQVVVWRIRQGVRLAYLRALLAQKQVDLLQENGRYFEQVIEYHRVRVEQGAMAEADLIRVRLEGERLRLAEQSAQVEAERQRVELLRSMGLSEGLSDFRVSDILPPEAELRTLSADALLTKAQAHRPELLLGAALVERAQARAELEKALAKPDWTVSFGYKRTAGFNTMLAGVAVPLPLFNKNEGNIIFSRQDVGRAEHLLQETAAQTAADIAAAVAGILRRQAMLTDMQKGIMQQAEESLRISLAAYQEGGSDLLRLLDAQRVRNEVQLLFSRTQMEYLISLAELDSAVGEEAFLPLKEVQRENP